MKLSMDELYQQFEKGLSPKEIIVDVRDAEDYAEVHVPGSRSIPHDQVLSNPEKFKTELQGYDRIFIHCGGGGKAGRVYDALKAIGMTNIVHICDSGMRSWIAAGRPVQKAFALFCLASLLLLSHSTIAASKASAPDPTGFICWPDVHSSRMVAYKNGNRLNLKISNPMGYEMMPQFDGPVSQFMLPSVQQQTSALQSLGDEFEISWPAEKCSTFKPESNQITCDGMTEVGTSGVQAVLAKSYKVTEENEDGVYTSYKFRLALTQGGNTYFVTFVYPAQSCKAFH